MAFLAKLLHWWFLDHNICTVKPSGAGDVCSGDSGNGVIIKTESGWVIVALPSLIDHFTSHIIYTIYCTADITSSGWCPMVWAADQSSEVKRRNEKKNNDKDFYFKENLCQGYQGECLVLLTGFMPALRMELFVILSSLSVFSFVIKTIKIRELNI